MAPQKNLDLLEESVATGGKEGDRPVLNVPGALWRKQLCRTNSSDDWAELLTAVLREILFYLKI